MELFLRLRGNGICPPLDIWIHSYYGYASGSHTDNVEYKATFILYNDTIFQPSHAADWITLQVQRGKYLAVHESNQASLLKPSPSILTLLRITLRVRTLKALHLFTKR